MIRPGLQELHPVYFMVKSPSIRSRSGNLQLLISAIISAPVSEVSVRGKRLGKCESQCGYSFSGHLEEVDTPLDMAHSFCGRLFPRLWSTDFTACSPYP